jgi:hypothetical protein
MRKYFKEIPLDVTPENSIFFLVQPWGLIKEDDRAPRIRCDKKTIERLFNLLISNRIRTILVSYAKSINNERKDATAFTAKLLAGVRKRHFFDLVVIGDDPPPLKKVLKNVHRDNTVILKTTTRKLSLSREYKKAAHVVDEYMPENVKYAFLVGAHLGKMSLFYEEKPYEMSLTMFLKHLSSHVHIIGVSSLIRPIEKMKKPKMLSELEEYRGHGTTSLYTGDIKELEKWARR